jgi:transcriptional regulator with XRE-family HTH domain
LTGNPVYWILALTILEDALDIQQRIAARLREFRGARGLSLEALAADSGVSRSMISLIERGESSPTAVVLDKLAVALGVTLATLFDAGGGATAQQAPLARRAEQAEWQDPDSGYWRRNVSPAGASQPMRIVEVRFPPRARVAFEASDPRTCQQIWLLDGSIDITQGSERHRLQEGDCLAMRLDRPAVFSNPTAKTARYAVVISANPAAR